MSLPLPDGFSLHCGARGVELYKQVNVNLRSLGCSMVAGNDLFDLGFRVEELEKYGLELRWGSTVLVKWPPLIDDNPRTRDTYGSDTGS